VNRTLTLYQYIAPAILAPLSFWLWRREYAGDLRLVAAAWLVPVLWAYLVPGIGTNVLKVWEFNTRLRLGRLVHAPVRDLFDVFRSAFVLCSVLAFWNLLYDIKAIRANILIVYNQPWAEDRGEAAIAIDYAPWFFGGFGAVYGAGMGAMEWLNVRARLTAAGFAIALTLMLILCLGLPVAGFILHSRRTHGHSGTRPVEKTCRNA
jgi:hypothetical protein